jgi:uncharacterized peroxidase-related enzyme
MTETLDAVDHLDHLDHLAGLQPGSRVHTLRRQRQAVRDATEGSRRALFDHIGPAPGLPLAERALVAQHVAGGPELQAAAANDRRLALLLAFADRLAHHPAQAEPRHVDTLLRPGFGPAELVTLAQVVAFSSYELRLAAGLRALDAAGPGQAQAPADDTHRAGTHTLQPAPLRRGRFVLDELQWRSWLPLVDVASASADQLAVLDESHASARTTPYYLTLLHNPPVLRQRSRLFNAILYGPGGLPRAERELATVAVSRVNGCPYCASVHARLFVQLAKAPQVIDAIYAEGPNTPLPPRLRALVDLALDLSLPQPQVAPGRMVQLRAAGLDDLQVLDAVHAVAMFAWANRLMQTLGEPVDPGQG